MIVISKKESIQYVFDVQIDIILAGWLNCMISLGFTCRKKQIAKGARGVLAWVIRLLVAFLGQ